MDGLADSGTAARSRRKKSGLSYKFQRLRERLREAVKSGELAGKLPGERALARRFHVNAKTLSKALTDLAAEGLLDRSIGRGTYVKGSVAEGQPRVQRWLVVCEADRAQTALGRLLTEANAESQVVHDVSALRPSFLKQFDVVIDLGRLTPESFLREMVVRGTTVIAVDREPGVCSVNLVAADRALGAALMTRDLVLGGHRRIAVVQALANSSVAHAAEQAAARYSPDAQVQTCTMDQVVDTVRAGVTAVVCDCGCAAARVRQELEARQIRVPDDVSVAAVGCVETDVAITGYYAECAPMVELVCQIARGENAGRPVTLWLVPRLMDLGTVRVLRQHAIEQAA